MQLEKSADVVNIVMLNVHTKLVNNFVTFCCYFKWSVDLTTKIGNNHVIIKRTQDLIS